MKCIDLHKDYISLAEGSLNKEEEQILRSHLESCADCKKEFDFVLASMNAIEGEKIQEADPYFFTRLEQKMENQKVQSVPLQLRFKQSLVYAFVIIAIVGGVFLGNLSFQQFDFMNEVENEILALELLPSYEDNTFTME